MALHKIATAGWLIPGDSPHYIPSWGYRGPYIAGRVNFSEVRDAEVAFTENRAAEVSFSEVRTDEVAFSEVL